MPGDDAGNGEPRLPPDACLFFASEPLAIRAALQRVRTSLAPLDLGEDTRGAVEIVLAEVLNNVAEHAYRTAPGDVELSLGQDRDHLVFTVRDRGRPMPDELLPEGRLEAPPSSLPEGGFGWFLIRTHAASLCYERQSGQNRLSFSLQIA